jgi:hypothetical protein
MLDPVDQMRTTPIDPAKGKIQRRVLSAREQFDLTNFVQKEYTASKKSDVDFVFVALDATLIPGLTFHHIRGARLVLGLENNLDVLRKEKAAAPVPDERVALLDKRLTSAEAQIRKLFAAQSECHSVPIPSDTAIIRLKDNIWQDFATESSDEKCILLVHAVLRGECK